MNIKENIRNLKSEIHNPRKYAVCEPKNNVERIVSMAILVSLATASCGVNNVKTQDVDFIPAESTTYITEPTESTSVSTSTTKTTTEFTTMLTTTTDVSTEISNASDSTTATEQETVAKPVEVKLEEPTYADPVIETEPVVVQPVEEYLVYKPSTHYAHKNTCRWNSGDAYRCDDFSELEVRICSECNPEVGEHIEYVEPEPTYSVYLSDTDKYYLAVMLCHECSNRAGAEHNAHSVAAMVNRGGTIYGAISSSCCPWWGYGHGSWCMDNGCMNGLDSSYAYEAIDYYLAHSDNYSWVTGWCASGDGIHNSYH